MKVRTSLRASSTGYPFKVASVPGTIADPSVYARRERKCDLGYLREAYLKPNGSTGYRCAAEPVDAYMRKGGDARSDRRFDVSVQWTDGDVRARPVPIDGRREPPIVTSGDCINDIRSC